MSVVLHECFEELPLLDFPIACEVWWLWWKTGHESTAKKRPTQIYFMIRVVQHPVLARCIFLQEKEAKKCPKNKMQLFALWRSLKFWIGNARRLIERYKEVCIAFAAKSLLHSCQTVEPLNRDPRRLVMRIYCWSKRYKHWERGIDNHRHFRRTLIIQHNSESVNNLRIEKRARNMHHFANSK